MSIFRIVISLLLVAILGIFFTTTQSIARDAIARPCRSIMVGPMVGDCGMNNFNNYNIEYQTDNVIPLAKKLKDKISSYKGAEMQSFSANLNNANIYFYFPIDEGKKLFEELISDPQISSINQNINNIDNSYALYARKYKLFKILQDNFGQVEEILNQQKCTNDEILEMSKILQENLTNYKSTMDNYEKQLNKTYFNIYIRSNKK